MGTFETGVLNMKGWKGSWISDNHDIAFKPAPYFRKAFNTDKPIQSARAYIAVGGLYELSINGQKVGNHRLDPVYSRFDRRNYYVTHDVTAAVKQGRNAIGVVLGNGWYNHQSTAVWDFHVAPWRARPAFCMDLRINYMDGTTETISTGKDWKTSTGGLVFNSIYTAEHFDARLEPEGWNTVGFDDDKWNSVIYRAAPSTNIVAQVLHPIRNVERIDPVSMKQLNDTTYLFDLGRNIAGVSQIKVTGPQGTVLRLKHGERLSKNGKVDLSNIDVHYRPKDNTDPFQTDIFILNGKGVEEFMPRFNYKGFQYVEVNTSKPIVLTKESLVGYFMHSDVPVMGTLSSSNPVINNLWTAANSSYLSNLFGYPTDCPQREKNGWTGDAHINVETGLYNYDGITVYEKWMRDHQDEQQPNGILPSIIPTGGWGYEWGNGPDWTSTIAIIPWQLYLFYGDTTTLSQCYENIKRYVNYIDNKYPTGLTTWGLGDWVPVKSKSPVEFTSSAFYHLDVSILAKAAKLFGKKEDYNKYQVLAQKIKRVINKKYLNTEKGIYGTGLQTELSFALYFNLVPDSLKNKVAKNFAKRVAADSFHLDVGLLGTKTILNALSENGYADIAYKLAAQETYPSWGWWIKNGATTFYENWDINATADISLNHIMFGEVNAWLYKGLGGIKPDEKKPGFKHIHLQPHFVEGLDSFSADYKGPKGKIVSTWKKASGKIIYAVKIPPNSTATLILPASNRLVLNKTVMKPVIINENNKSIRKDQHSYWLEAGTYNFQIL